MRYATKVTALMVLVSVAPVAASGLVSASLSGDAVAHETYALQQGLARQTAHHANSWFASVVGDLRRAASYLPFDDTTNDELAALLRVPFRQLQYVTAMVLLDSSGKAVVPPVYLPAQGGELPDDLKDRARLTPVDLKHLARHIPHDLALKKGTAFGPAYRSAGGAERMVCAAVVPASGRVSADGLVLAAELSLARVREILRMGAPPPVRSFLVDARQKVVLASSGEGFGRSVARLAPVAGEQEEASYQGLDGEPVLGVSGRVPILAWTVLLEEPLSAAMTTSRRLRLYTAAWTALCVLLAILGGVQLSRGVTRPVGELASAVSQIQGGNYQVQVQAQGRDELAQLAQAFNEMSTAVQRSVEVIEAQRDELQQWNEELQRRVEERTHEVHEALEQVIRSQKLGALGELGAGMAHELNNPLTGIMGLSQILLTSTIEEPEALRENLEQIVEQARRMRDIVQSLQRFSETPEDVRYILLDVAELCQSMLSLVGSRLEQARVNLRLSIAEDLPAIRGSEDELRQVLLHLVHNAIRAMPTGGELSINARQVEGAVRIVIADTGRGIPESMLGRIFEPFFAQDKTETHRPGLGLSVSHRIVTEHHGRITVRSEVGKGTEFAISLPGVRKELHLR